MLRGGGRGAANDGLRIRKNNTISISPNEMNYDNRVPNDEWLLQA